MPELEMTPIASRAVPDVSQPIPELERHRSGPVAAAPTAPIPELERTRHAPLPAVPKDVVPELEYHQAPQVGPRTAPPPDAVTCRYCRNVQPTGMLCDRCGMRLPRLKVAAKTGKPQSFGEDGYERCPLCKQFGSLGKKCKECGTLIVPAED
jgi:hypothetical protein